jgi:DNA-binding transcriptional LysR family regulator
MKIDEKHLAQLAAVVETGSLTNAARQMGLSQPALSRTISRLEKRLGEPLFEPGKRPLRPTIIGRQLAEQGRVILEASRKASDTVRSFRAGSVGTVRIAGVPFFMDAFISRMIGQFQMQQPDIQVDQSYGNLPELESGIASNRLDLAITPIGMVDAGRGFSFTPILPGRNIVACRSIHPLLRQRQLTINDLVEFPWIAPLPGSPLLADLHAILLYIGMSEINIRYSGGSLLSVLNYLEETDALTVLPLSVVYAHSKTNRVAVLPIDIPQPDRTLGILRLIGGPRIPAAERLAQHIATRFDDIRQTIRLHENSLAKGTKKNLTETP